MIFLARVYREAYTRYHTECLFARLRNAIKESDVATTYSAAPIVNPHAHGTVLRIPSMSADHMLAFVRIIGQYNRGLVTLTEMVEELNRVIVFSHDDDQSFYVSMFRPGAQLAIEPRFANTADGAIACRVHFV